LLCLVHRGWQRLCHPSQYHIALSSSWRLAKLCHPYQLFKQRASLLKGAAGEMKGDAGTFN
jgi:hypothetical protein